MRVSTKGRYGLRTLVDICLHQAQGAVTLNDIAKRQGISVKYLWQVINPLKTSGLLNVTRGAKGGYMLSRRPDEINMLEVISTLEGPLSVVDCVMDVEYCDRIDTCVARTVWVEVNEAVERTLKAITLAEILRRFSDRSEGSSYVI